MSSSEASLVRHSVLMKSSLTGLLIRIEQKVWHDPETGLYVSHCDPLDVCSQGDTEEEALANLNEAIQIFLSTCYEMGTLNEVLIECGLTPTEDGDEHGNGAVAIGSPVLLKQKRRKENEYSDDGCPKLDFQNQKSLSSSSN